MSRAACAGALGYDRYACFGNRARFRVFGSEPLHAPVPGAGRHHSEQLPMVDALGQVRMANRSPVRARLESERRAFRRVARIFQRREKIFLALACEFFLRCPEVCNARRDFFTLSSDFLLLFGHAHPFLSRVPRSLVVAIGARIGARRCRIVVANRVGASQVHSAWPCYIRRGQTFGYSP